jgi:transposase
MDHFAGLDVSVKETSVCIVDDAGKIVWEVKVASEREVLLAVLKNSANHFERIGLEAGPLSQWLYNSDGINLYFISYRHRRTAQGGGSPRSAGSAIADRRGRRRGIVRPACQVRCRFRSKALGTVRLKSRYRFGRNLPGSCRPSWVFSVAA